MSVITCINLFLRYLCHSLHHCCIGMSYSKPTNECIDNGDDEDDDESDIVDNVSISLMVLLVYVKAAKDEEENSNKYL